MRDGARELLSRVGFIELLRPTLERALEAFPIPVRTLDAIHLASLEFMRAQGQSIQLASYDQRQLAVAKKLKIEALALSSGLVGWWVALQSD